MRFLSRLFQIALLFVLLEAPAAEPAAADSKKEKKDEKPRITLPPEAEVKFADFLKKLRAAKLKVWVSSIKEEIKVLAKTVELKPEAITTLEQSGEKVA